jgi:hypothetical protein
MYFCVEERDSLDVIILPNEGLLSCRQTKATSYQPNQK